MQGFGSIKNMNEVTEVLRAVSNEWSNTSSDVINNCLYNYGGKVMQASYVEVRIVLSDLNYPLTKQNLIQQALKRGASRCVIEDLKSIPDHEYLSSVSVFKEFRALSINGTNNNH